MFVLFEVSSAFFNFSLSLFFVLLLHSEFSTFRTNAEKELGDLKGLVQELLSHIKGQAPPSADQCRTAAGTSLGHHDRDDPDHGPEGENAKRQRLEGVFTPSTSQAASSEKGKEVARTEGGAQDEGVSGNQTEEVVDSGDRDKSLSELLEEEMLNDSDDQELNLQMVVYDPAVAELNLQKMAQSPAVVERTEPIVLEDSEEDKVAEPEGSEEVIEMLYAGISAGDSPVRPFTEFPATSETAPIESPQDFKGYWYPTFLVRRSNREDHVFSEANRSKFS